MIKTFDTIGELPEGWQIERSGDGCPSLSGPNDIVGMVYNSGDVHFYYRARQPGSDLRQQEGPVCIPIVVAAALIRAAALWLLGDVEKQEAKTQRRRRELEQAVGELLP